MTEDAMERPGRIWAVHGQGGAVLHLCGEIDLVTVAGHEAVPTDRRADGAAPVRIVAIDSAAVTFMSAAGVSLLLRVTAPVRATGLRPVLRRPSRPVRRILELTGLEASFDWR